MSNVEIIRRGDMDPWERGYPDGKVVRAERGRIKTIRETTRLYAYFCVYRDLGPIERTYPKVAEKTGRQQSYITKIAMYCDWTSRCEAWDAMQESRKRITQQAAIDEMNDRQARMAVTMLSAIGQRLVGDEKTGVKAIDPNTLGPKDIARLAEVATKIERVARGSETEITRETGDVKIRVAFDISPNIPDSSAPPLVEPRALTAGGDE